ncbi:barstar family protein [Rhodococcus sp. NPDC060176]|uniref:barstar family protein n=1 Tax=Rhodococcus sp. NPDC060176 TaxID=3347062 RepID=UPI00365CA383
MSDSSTVSVAQWLDPSSDVASVALRGEQAVADDLARELRGENFVVRVVRGENMRTTSQVFDEFAAAFQFPSHFGRNKDAFDDVMRDLDDVLGLGAGYVVVIRGAGSLLSEQQDQLEWFRETMDFYTEEWEPVVFRTVYQFGEDDLSAPGEDLVELDYPGTTPPH